MNSFVPIRRHIFALIRIITPVLLIIALLNASVHADQPFSIVRVSTDSAGGQSNNYSDYPIVSADGRYVIFHSAATNLVAGDTNGDIDAFIKDTQTGVITRISTDGSGNQANDSSFPAGISANNRYVTLLSAATNLVAGDTNGARDVFVKDLQTGNVSRISTDSSGNQSNGGSTDAQISADGRYVAFASVATNLVAGDTNGQNDIFVKDLQTGSISRANTTNLGAEASSGLVSYWAFSANGRYVVFDSTATNLVAGDTNGQGDVFKKDMQTGVITRVSVNPSGVQSVSLSYQAAVSADGRYVAFNAGGDDLAPGDSNGTYDTLVKDTQTGSLIIASSASDGTQANDYSDYIDISSDGRYVVMDSSATNLVPNDTNGNQDIFVKELQTGNIARLTRDTNGVQGGAGYSYNPSLSADGKYVAFYSDVTNLVLGDTNATSDIFLAANPLWEVLDASTENESPKELPDSAELADTGTNIILSIFIGVSILGCAQLLSKTRYKKYKLHR